MSRPELVAYFGITITLVGVGILILLAVKARKISPDMNSELRSQTYRKLIMMNFLGIGFGATGLVVLLLSRIL